MSSIDFKITKNRCLEEKKKKKRKHSEEFEDELPALEGIGKLLSQSHSEGISKHKNHIYFYGDVTTQNCLQLNQEISALNNELQKVSLDFDVEHPKIYLHINSYGGELLAGFSSIDYIMNSTVPIVSIIEGCAASAATLMSVVAAERYMTKHSFMLIHQLSGATIGTFEELKDDMKNSERFMDMIYDIYVENTKLSKKKLMKVLKKDLWWDSELCNKYGLIDGVWNNDTNQVNKKSRFENTETEEDSD